MLGLAAAIPAALTPSAARAGRDDRALRGQARGKARNVILMVSDGMSFGTLTLGDLLVRRSTGKPGAWSTLWAQPGTCRVLQRTHALNSLVTDSAAAATAWGSGVKVNNGSVNVAADARQLLPLGIHAKQHRKAVGVATTTRVTHATPAGFYANVPRRDYEGIIAEQSMDRGIDVILGGGERFFAPSLINRHPAYQFVRTKAELQNARSDGPLLGLFAESHVPYAIDRAPTVPDLATMSLAALDRLSRAPEGFLLQIEAGRVDHAAHDNDAAALVGEQIEFENAIAAVWAWLQKRGVDDTLLIVTSDHGNANPGLSVYHDDAEQGLNRLLQPRKSFEWIGEQLAEVKGIDARLERFPALVREASGYTLTPADLDLIARVLREQRVTPFEAQNKWPSVLGGILANHFGVNFISPNHSADYVETTAIGPGSELVAEKARGSGGVIDNTDLHAVMVDAMALGPGTLTDDMKTPMPVRGVIKPD